VPLRAPRARCAVTALTGLSGAGRGMPVVVTGAMDAWPAFREGGRKWSIDWFAQTYGHVKPGTGIDTAGVKEYISLGEYLAKFDEYAKVCVCACACAPPDDRCWCARTPRPRRRPSRMRPCPARCGRPRALRAHAAR
jgi:hypothetical protein